MGPRMELSARPIHCGSNPPGSIGEVGQHLLRTAISVVFGSLELSKLHLPGVRLLS